mmetsp:Transcript_8153/g.19701  ORF Transcript_8153/g.19701 Transcript_8153/m.19701 type:complete len:261 (-) Transcript_8153:3468-4250(-)
MPALVERFVRAPGMGGHITLRKRVNVWRKTVKARKRFLRWCSESELRYHVVKFAVFSSIRKNGHYCLYSLHSCFDGPRAAPRHDRLTATSVFSTTPLRFSSLPPLLAKCPRLFSRLLSSSFSRYPLRCRFPSASACLLGFAGSSFSASLHPGPRRCRFPLAAPGLLFRRATTPRSGPSWRTRASSPAPSFRPATPFGSAAFPAPGRRSRGGGSRCRPSAVPRARGPRPPRPGRDWATRGTGPRSPCRSAPRGPSAPRTSL